MENNLNKDIDLTAIWKKMAAEKFSNSQIEKQNIMDTIKLKSNNDILLLKKNLGIKILWCVGFIIAFVAILLYNINNIEFVKSISILIGMYILGGTLMYSKYRTMGNEPQQNASILVSMKHNLKAIKSALNYERIWGIFGLPLAVPLGLLISKTLKGATIIETIQDTKLITTALVMILVLVPILSIAVDKMNKKAYGTQIKNLEDNIIRMETLE